MQLRDAGIRQPGHRHPDPLQDSLGIEDRRLRMHDVVSRQHS